MAWYRTGTVSVSNGSATVTGVGTAFNANVKVGEEFRLLGGDGYEIAAVVSDTQLTLARSFTGTSQSGQSYEIVPIKGFLKAAYDALTAAIAQFQTYANGALSGRFGDGSVGAPAISFLSNTGMGFYKVAANQIGIATNGIRRVLLTTSAMQVDVPITGTAVQSNAWDSTTGRVLTNGAHGLGAKPKSLTSSDDYSGFEEITTFIGNTSGSSMPSNGPSLSSGYAGLQVMTGSSRGAQLLMRSQGAVSSGVKAFLRGFDATWGSWVELLSTSHILGTVSQSGGVPTGAIIERGSNANGEYAKFADGTLICTNQAFATSASADVTWTYPHQFAYPASPGRPAVGGSVSSTFGQACFLSVGGIAGTGGFSTSVSVRAVDTAGARQALDASLIAIGRWF